MKGILVLLSIFFQQHVAVQGKTWRIILRTQFATYGQAEKDCQDHQGKLAVVNTFSDKNDLVNMLPKRGKLGALK